MTGALQADDTAGTCWIDSGALASTWHWLKEGGTAKHGVSGVHHTASLEDCVPEGMATGKQQRWVAVRRHHELCTNGTLVALQLRVQVTVIHCSVCE